MPKFTFVRHGNALPPTEGQNDMDRELSTDGKRQADERGIKLGTLGHGPVFHSPAQRTYGTAALIALHARSVNHDLIKVPELFSSSDTADNDKLAEMFTELKYAPPAKYLQRDEPVMRRIAKEASNAVRKSFHAWQEANTKVADSVLIVGHAVMLQMMAMELCPDVEEEVLASLVLGEAQGFTILEDGATIVLHQD